MNTRTRVSGPRLAVDCDTPLADMPQNRSGHPGDAAGKAARRRDTCEVGAYLCAAGGSLQSSRSSGSSTGDVNRREDPCICRKRACRRHVTALRRLRQGPAAEAAVYAV